MGYSLRTDGPMDRYTYPRLWSLIAIFAVAPNRNLKENRNNNNNNNYQKNNSKNV